MNPKIFDIVEGNVVITAEALIIPAFELLWKNDKSKNKEVASKSIKYIVLMYKWDSPYASYIDDNTRHKKLATEMFGDEKWQPDTITKEAINMYKTFQNTFSLQFLEANMYGAKKLMEYYYFVNWEEEDKLGKPKYSNTALAANLEKAGGIIKSISTLIEQVKKEQLGPEKSKGGAEISYFERVK